MAKSNDKGVNLGSASDKDQIAKEVKGLASEVKEIEQRGEWLMMLKTHIAKYQSDQVAFSVKKYFQKWRSKSVSGLFLGLAEELKLDELENA